MSVAEATANTGVSAIQKLGIRPGMRILVLNAPPGGLPKAWGSLPEGVKVSTMSAGDHPFVLAFVSSKSDIERFAPLAIAAGPGTGALWFAYPKKSGIIKTDITRDIGWDALDAHGYRPVTQISLDSTWTGFRFRPVALVRKR